MMSLLSGVGVLVETGENRVLGLLIDKVQEFEALGLDRGQREEDGGVLLLGSKFRSEAT